MKKLLLTAVVFLASSSGMQAEGNKVNRLYGVSGIIALIGETMFFKFLRRAWESMADKCVCKLRRGLQVSLYVK